ncbi:hypothetical protein KUTeg_017366 [Tegillarca granosa]|uniref:Disease resistance R13L4/SHOC-2-like LRR domain-containing protein n=1 Tax=Tegillarca granosa TaxID=220873 RepID=A0ABQ9ENF0_TEGGR|nr:hypothetical protein KUTeg_017366 [Tegillarca granosa]
MAYYYPYQQNVPVIKTLRLRIETEDPLYLGQKKLKMRGKDLIRLPEALFNIIELEVLDLSPERQSCLDYKLTTLPRSIGKLVNLTVLVLDTNELSALPQEICKLRNLERLALSNNMLSSLPSGFKQLDKLQSLHMANNEFEDFPDEICELKSLEFLDMSDNLLTKLPNQIQNLKNVHTLLLFGNKLSILPDSICSMKELRCIWLGNNLIRDLPRDFGKLKHIDWELHYTSTALDGNPLVHPPIEICRLGSDAIDRYLTSSKNLSGTPRDSSLSPQDNVSGSLQDDTDNNSLD